MGLYPHGASLQGALDLAGNVWEWCRNSRGHPGKADVEDDVGRVVRGGCWNNALGFARTANRYSSQTVNRNYFIGFRLVCASLIA